MSRRVLTFLLVAALAATVALAQSPTGPAQPFRPALSASANLFARLWSFLAPSSGRNGCSVDPSGRCLPQGSGLVAEDNGCQVDPSGLCRKVPRSVQTKNGCQVDPDGRCMP